MIQVGRSDQYRLNTFLTFHNERALVWTGKDLAQKRSKQHSIAFGANNDGDVQRALKFRAELGFISFGGPPGQVAIMR
jgi:hypothetical protein